MLNGVNLEAVVIATGVSFPLSDGQSRAAGRQTHFHRKADGHVPSSIARNWCEIAQKNGLVLMTGHTFLYSPVVRKIKEIIDKGDIGEIRYICARRLNLGLFQKDINVAWDLAPHDISIILSIMGEQPATVNCRGSAHITPGIEDVTTMCLTFSKQRSAIIHSSWLDPRKVREMTIVGSKRMIVYDDVAPLEKIRVFDTRVERPPHYDTFGEFQYAYHYGDMYAPYIKQEEPLKTECQHFLDCIRTGIDAGQLRPARHGAGENFGSVIRILAPRRRARRIWRTAATHITTAATTAVARAVRPPPRKVSEKRLDGQKRPRSRPTASAAGQNCFEWQRQTTHERDRNEPIQRIAPDVKLGRNVRIFGFTNLYGCEIGDDVKIGTFVEIQKGAKIGNRCKISSHTFICEGVTLEDEVFIGHNVVFTNDRYPALDRQRKNANRSRLDLHPDARETRRVHRFRRGAAVWHHRRRKCDDRRRQRGDQGRARRRDGGRQSGTGRQKQERENVKKQDLETRERETAKITPIFGLKVAKSPRLVLNPLEHPDWDAQLTRRP